MDVRSWYPSRDRAAQLRAGFGGMLAAARLVTNPRYLRYLVVSLQSFIDILLPSVCLCMLSSRRCPQGQGRPGQQGDAQHREGLIDEQTASPTSRLSRDDQRRRRRGSRARRRGVLEQQLPQLIEQRK